IDETLKKIATSTSKANTPATSNTDLPGDPNCPFCGGVGYLRLDVPVGDPRFGRLELCTCRQRGVSENVRQRLYAMSHLDELGHMTFETFKPRGRKGQGEMQAETLERAFNHARLYAGNLNGWLMLQGGFGSGKTHLAAAIANFAVSMGVPTLFLTVPDLLDMMRFAYGSEDTSFEDRFNEIRNASLLVLDDLGTQNATSWAQEKLFQILNYRYINKLPLVVTTNQTLDEIDPRIRSRLSDPELVSRLQLNVPDYRRPMDDTGHPELSSLGMMSGKTFGSFDERGDEGLPPDDLKSLQRALKAAHNYADRPRGWLVFLGGYGSGKTHLAAAIANYRAGMGDPPLFVIVPDLLDHLRATFNPNSNVTFDRRFDEIRTASLLILDDLGTQSTSPWVKEKLFQLINHRYNAELPTVITSADALDQMEPRIRSRLLDERLVTVHAITVPAYHGGKRVVKKKYGR
ncbi:MAG TPA: ATP-binding protein, partial [Anaerolineales bacterium]